MTRQVLAAVLIQAAALCCPTLGAALDAPDEVTVVVPAEAAWIVVSAVPVFNTVITVPIAKLVVASVGMLTVLAEAFDVKTRTWY